jgi:Plasmid pRiA4b ORF-3-like protein
VARTWLSIRVDLIEGHGEQSWPRPGRIFAAARSHTFKQLADAIDDALGRWDRSHLQEFTLADGRRLCDPDPDWEIGGEVTLDYRRVKLSRPHPGAQFAYVFDLGDAWAHLCTVGPRRIDPAGVLGIPPDRARALPGCSGTPDCRECGSTHIDRKAASTRSWRVVHANSP